MFHFILLTVMANCPHTIGVSMLSDNTFCIQIVLIDGNFCILQVEFGTRIIEVAGQKIKLQIW